MDHLSGIRDRAVFTPMKADERRALLEQRLPDQGRAPHAILDLFRDAVLAHPMGNGHPRFFGWVNSPPAPLGVDRGLPRRGHESELRGRRSRGDLRRARRRALADGARRLPDRGSMGLLVSGTSVATIVALAAARQRVAAAQAGTFAPTACRARSPRLRLYVSAEGHSCLRKAAELLGLGASAIRAIPVDDDFAMDVRALRDAIAADRRAGDVPFFVAASAGTVGTGAIDPARRDRGPLRASSACGSTSTARTARSGCWRTDRSGALRGHGRARTRSRSILTSGSRSPSSAARSSSATATLLRDTFSFVPPYLRTEEGKGFGGLPWFSEYGVQQTRGFRALKLWMVLQHLGRSGVTRMVERHIALAQHLATLIDAAPIWSVSRRSTSRSCAFRYAAGVLRGDDARLDALNKRIMEQMQAEGAAFVTNTSDPRTLRAARVHPPLRDDGVRRRRARRHRPGGRAPRLSARPSGPNEGPDDRAVRHVRDTVTIGRRQPVVQRA